jgi:transposase
MDVVLERVAGLDVHQATVVATVRVPSPSGRQVVTETFGTMVPDLLALREWLQAYGVTHVALESTGVYWKPVYYVLEDGFTLLLINMQELKHLPGRKTDVKDSEWLAQLLECGLLRASFVPPPPIRELRDLTRYRVQQVRDRAQEVNRLCKVLEDTGLKLTTVVSDVMGVSGRAMLAALVEGTTDPAVLGAGAGPAAQEAAGAGPGAAGAVSSAPRVSRRADSRQDRFSGGGDRAPADGDRRAPGPFRADADRAGHHSGRGPDRGDQYRG